MEASFRSSKSGQLIAGNGAMGANAQMYLGIRSSQANECVFLFEDLKNYEYYRLSNFRIDMDYEWWGTGTSISGEMKFGTFVYENDSSLGGYSTNEFSQAINAPYEGGYNVIAPIPLDSVMSKKGFFDKFSVKVSLQATATGAMRYIIIPVGTLLRFSYDYFQPLKPDTLSPNGVNRNAKAPIALSWNAEIYTGDDVIKEDTIISYALRYQVNSGTWQQITINSSVPGYTFPANTFVNGNVIKWQVKSTSEHNGDSEWSDIATFTCSTTPPSKSTLYYPINNAMIMGGTDIGLEWIYNSDYDTTPSKFDVQYRIDSGAWISGTTNGQTVYKIPAINNAAKVDWQVRAYGQLGDVGLWSDIATFFVAGKPARPVIVSVTNSGRPTITWNAVDVQMWELQILHNNKLIFETGRQPYLKTNVYKLPIYLDDAQYVVRMSIYNARGFQSDWGEKAFSISTAKPAKPIVRPVNNNGYCIKLYLEYTTTTAYVYRSEINSNDYTAIGALSNGEKYYEDYTAAPNVMYKYFIKAVNANDSFNDSAFVSEYIGFDETAIALLSDLKNMLLLDVNVNAPPQKSQVFKKNRTFLQYIGREYPVSEEDIFKNRELSLSFYVTNKQYFELESLVSSSELLILRDRRFGTIFGKFSGEISSSVPELKNGFIVTLKFVQLSYSQGVDL